MGWFSFLAEWQHGTQVYEKKNKHDSQSRRVNTNLHPYMLEFQVYKDELRPALFKLLLLQNFDTFTLDFL